MVAGALVSPILPPKEDEGELIPTSARIPKQLIARLDAIAKGARYSRNEVMIHFLRWAAEEFEREQSAGKKTFPKK